MRRGRPQPPDPGVASAHGARIAAAAGTQLRAEESGGGGGGLAAATAPNIPICRTSVVVRASLSIVPLCQEHFALDFF